jgi:hypothetical protein
MAKARPRTFLRRAMLVSLAFHLCAAMLLAFAPHATALRDDRTTEIIRTLPVTIARRSVFVAVTSRPLVATPRPPPARTVSPRHASAAPTALAAAPPPKRATRTSVEPVEAKPIRATQHAVILAPLVTVVVVPSPSATPSPSASASSSPAPAAVAVVQADMPPGGWGQSFAKPLVADDEALASLRASVHARAIATIEVDNSGHAIRVTLPQTLAADLRAEIEKRLLALQYVPAECNGLRCSGTLELAI